MYPPALVAPAALAGRLGGLLMPGELYWVTREPVLAGMSYPHRVDWDELFDAGLRVVVCLTHDDPPYDPAPLALVAVGLQDLLTRGPLDPVHERERVAVAARAVVGHLERGEGVVVHCHGGRGRAGTVIGCALVMLGHDPEAVIDHLHEVQRVRNKKGWPEHPWQAETVRACAPHVARHPGAD
ncbi:MAG: tyrosine-protein phosphatase [Acidimicrobiia bacterium]